MFIPLISYFYKSSDENLVVIKSLQLLSHRSDAFPSSNRMLPPVSNYANNLRIDVLFTYLNFFVTASYTVSMWFIYYFLRL